MGSLGIFGSSFYDIKNAEKRRQQDIDLLKRYGGDSLDADTLVSDVWRYGELTYTEIGARHPILVLGRYEICKLNGEVVKNLEDDLARFYVLDTEKCDRLEFVYSDIAEDEDEDDTTGGV